MINNNKKVILPITVLVHDGIMARTYLVRLLRAGFIPAAILLLVYKHEPKTGKQIGRWLPAKLRLNYAKKAQEMFQNYWPRRLRKDEPDLFGIMTKIIAQSYVLPLDIYDEILGSINYEEFTETFQTIMVDDYKDPALQVLISNLRHKTILFTGGGILPPNLIALQDIRFVHVHPGFLPHIRGSDGLLWSTLIRGKPGVSIFYMDTAIDWGNIITAGEFPSLAFPVKPEDRPDDQTLYRMVFSYYDPMLRAQKLIKVLNQGKDLGSFPSNSQDLSSGVTYHFMHPAMRNVALKRLYPNGA